MGSETATKGGLLSANMGWICCPLKARKQNSAVRRGLEADASAYWPDPHLGWGYVLEGAKGTTIVRRHLSTTTPAWAAVVQSGR